MATKSKNPSLTAVRRQLNETFRKWGKDYELLFTANTRNAHQLHAGYGSKATIVFSWRGKRVLLSTTKSAYPIENAIALAKAVEHIRMAEVRGIETLCYGILQFVIAHPANAPQSPPPRPEQLDPDRVVLCIAADAPLEVAEAAFKALARKHHPDVGGSTARMQQLNAAIERLRVKAGRS